MTEIKRDVFDIADRVREVDEAYFIVRNHKRGCFEVHARGQTPSTFCLTVPFSELDARTVELVRKTRAENAKKLFAEMERENERMKKREMQRAIDAAASAAGL